MNPSSQHPLLARQIRRHLGSDALASEQWAPFLEAVQQAYEAADEDRKMLERSLDLSSNELLEVNRGLREATRAAQAASAAKSDFLAMMSHEIRTPLNGIMGMTSLLLDTSLDADQTEFAQTVHRSSTTLLTILNDILDFSKIEAGALEVECVPCDLSEIVDGVVDSLTPLAEGKGIEFCHLLRRRVPRSVCADPLRLRQVLINLLGNAIKFTEEGEVTLMVSRNDHGEDGPELSFEISDTGIGIPKDRHQALFEPFTQADISTTRKHGGTGLGLAICKRLIDAMGGSLGVRSALGQGSTFWFTLPLKGDCGGANAEERPGLLRGKRVLVVDDNATNRMFLQHVIAGWGGESVEAEDGPSALQALRGTPDGWDLVYLDYAMPGMDGKEVFRQILADPSIAHVPVLMLTSIANMSLAKQLREAGLSGYLTKPIKEAALLKASQAALEQGRKAHTGVEAPKREETRAIAFSSCPEHQTNFRQALRDSELSGAVLSDASEVAELCAMVPTDLVLLDVSSEGADSPELFQRLLACEPRPVLLGWAPSPRPVPKELCAFMVGDLSQVRLQDFLAQASTVPQTLAAEVESPSSTVLIVDDNATNRKVLRYLLERQGVDCHVAEDGLEALQQIATYPYAAVLLDLRMPGLDGIQTADRIRRELESAVPIIGLTAGMGESEEEQFLQAGADQILLKPVDRQELLTTLEDLLGDALPGEAPAEDPEWRAAKQEFFGEA